MNTEEKEIDTEELAKQKERFVASLPEEQQRKVIDLPEVKQLCMARLSGKKRQRYCLSLARANDTVSMLEFVKDSDCFYDHSYERHQESVAFSCVLWGGINVVTYAIQRYGIDISCATRDDRLQLELVAWKTKQCQLVERETKRLLARPESIFFFEENLPPIQTVLGMRSGIERLHYGHPDNPHYFHRGLFSSPSVWDRIVGVAHLLRPDAARVRQMKQLLRAGVNLDAAKEIYLHLYVAVLSDVILHTIKSSWTDQAAAHHLRKAHWHYCEVLRLLQGQSDFVSADLVEAISARVPENIRRRHQECAVDSNERMVWYTKTSVEDHQLKEMHRHFFEGWEQHTINMEYDEYTVEFWEERFNVAKDARMHPLLSLAKEVLNDNFLDLDLELQETDPEPEVRAGMLTPVVKAVLSLSALWSGAPARAEPKISAAAVRAKEASDEEEEDASLLNQGEGGHDERKTCDRDSLGR